MTKSFFAHFSTITMAHILFLMGTWQISQSQYLRQKISSLGPGVLKLQIASRVVSSSSKIKPAKTLAPNNRRPIKPLEPSAIKDTAATATGSEFGSTAQGRNDLLSVYKAELRAMIDRNKSYPTLSRRLGQSGTVVVAFTLLEDGHIIDVRIDSPSRYDRLNESALDAVKKVERFKPIPKEIGEAKMDIKIPVKFVTI